MENGNFEVGEPDLRPCFGKILFDEVCAELEIPPAFMRHLENQIFNKVTLKSPCGSSWVVELKTRDEDTYLAKGWKMFAKKHKLCGLDYLVFKYNGNYSFDVDIYEASGWKRNYKTASAFTSPYPYFAHTMSYYNIGHKSCLVVPKEFANNLIRIPMKKSVHLQTLNGVRWSVNILCSGPQPLISKGWKTFADLNALNIGDICVFELVDVDVMKVHIFRSD